MPYRIRYSSSAKEDASHLDSYGADFREELSEWFKLLASEAETGKYTASIDAIEFFERLTTTESSPCDEVMTRSAWEYFKKQSFWVKMKALKVVIGKRCPPWTFRAATNWIKALNLFDMEVVVYFMVDHVQQQLVIYLIDFDRAQK